MTWLNNKGENIGKYPHLNSPGITVVRISRAHGLMNTHGQAIDRRGRVHVAIWHCTDESLRAAGSTSGEHRWGPPAARRNHHYWRDRKGGWHHTELPGTATTRPKIFLDKDDNAFVIYTNLWAGGLLAPEGSLTIMAATSEAKWKDWKTIHVEKGPFRNEMLIDYYRWTRDGTLSVLVQQPPKEAHQATPLRILDFTMGQE